MLTKQPSYIEVATCLLRRYFVIVQTSSQQFIDIGVVNRSAGYPLILVNVLTRNISQQLLWYCDEQGYIRSAKNDYAFDFGLYGFSTKLMD